MTAASERRAPGVMLSRITGALRSLLACGVARRAEGGVIELDLLPEEAAEGGMATISMWVTTRCPACSGSTAPSPCAQCRDTREVEALFSAWLAVPPDVSDGAILAPTVPLPGMTRPVEFRVRVRRAS